MFTFFIFQAVRRHKLRKDGKIYIEGLLFELTIIMVYVLVRVRANDTNMLSKRSKFIFFPFLSVTSSDVNLWDSPHHAVTEQQLINEI